MTALLDRLKYLRSLDLPPDLGQGLHPDRLFKFAREGAVAPVSLLKDSGERRRPLPCRAIQNLFGPLI